MKCAGQLMVLATLARTEDSSLGRMFTPDHLANE